MTLRQSLRDTALPIFLALWMALTPAFAGSMMLLGVGGPTVAATYQGPGDVITGASFWGSCARVYTAALASTSTSLCDLVDSAAPTVVICTLRGSSTGLVDLAGTYCTGSVTPSAKCAAATGAVCNISKIYDQTGTGNPLLQAIAATQAHLLFSAKNGLPGMTGTNAASTVMVSAGNITQTLPFSMSLVADRTTTSAGVASIAVGQRNLTVGIGGAAAANNLAVNSGGTFASLGGNDNVFHCVNTTFVSGAGTIANLDGVDSGSLNVGTSGFAGNPISMFRAVTVSFEGTIMEGGFWPTTSFSSGNRSGLCTNQRSATNGYNF